MQIFYRPMTSSVHALEVEASDTVAMLKARIGRNEGGVDPSHFYLIHQGNGSRLEEERTLASYNIQQNSTVTMMFRMLGNGHGAVPDTGVLFPIKIHVRGTGYAQVTDVLGSIPFQQRRFEVFLSRPCVGKVVLSKQDSDKAGFTPLAPETTLTVILPGFPPQEVTSTSTFNPLSGTSAGEVLANLRKAVLPCVPADYRRRGFDVFLTRPSGAQVLLDGAAVLASPHNATTTVHVRPKEALGRSATSVAPARIRLHYRRSTRETRVVNVEAADTVAMLMEKIGKRESVDPSKFYLICNGSRLEKERTLASYSFQQASSTVTMLFRMAPPEAPRTGLPRQAPVPSTRPRDIYAPVSAATQAAPTLSTVGTNTLNTSDVGTQCDPDAAAVVPPPRVRPPQRFKIFYRRLTNDARAVEVSPADTVAGLAARIAVLEGHNAASFHLAADGSVMAVPERTLASYNVQDGTTVTMLFRMS